MTYEKTCAICGKAFVANHYMIKYCSAKCKKVARSEQMHRYYERCAEKRKLKKQQRPLFCKICGNPIPADSHRSAYCSAECAIKANVAAKHASERKAYQKHCKEREWLFDDSLSEFESLLESDDEKVIFLFRKSIHPKLISKILNLPLETVNQILVDANLISAYAALHCEGKSIDDIAEIMGVTPKVATRYIPRRPRTFNAEFPSPHAEKLREYRKKKEQQEQE